jgi:hypothetical protein
MKVSIFFTLCLAASPVSAEMSDYDKGYAQGHAAGYYKGYIDGAGKGARPDTVNFPIGNSNGMELPEYLAIILNSDSGVFEISNSNAVPVFGAIDWSQDEMWQKVLSAGEKTGWVDPKTIMIVPRGAFNSAQEQSEFPTWSSETGTSQTMLGATAEVVPMLRGLTYSGVDPVFPAFGLK